MKISIIIPVYNEQKAIKVLLDSIAEIDYPQSEYEVIVVNDGSIDNTESVVKNYKNVRLINHEYNQGRFDARKTGMEQAKYNNLLFIDSRSILSKEILHNLADKKDNVLIGHSRGREKETAFEILYLAIRRQLFRKFIREMKNRIVLTKENFDTYPKGTGILFIKKPLLEEVIGKFGSSFGKESSEDTRLLSYVLEKTEIVIDPDIWVINYAREDFGKSLGHIFERGIHFTDYYLKSGAPKHKLILLFPLVALLVTGILYRLLGGYSILLIGSLWLLISVYLDRSPYRATVIFLLAPLTGIFFYLGVLKGIASILYKKIGKKKLLNILTLVIIGISVYYLVRNYEDFKILGNLKWIEVVVLVLLNLVLITINGAFSWYLYRQFDLKLGIIESIQLSVATSFGNTFLPLRSGMGIQAIYLKKRHNFSYSYFASTIAGAYVINFFVIGMLGISSMAIIYLTKGIFSTPVFLAFLALSAGMVLAVKSSSLFLRLIPFPGIRNKAKTVLEGWRILSKSPRKVLIMGVITTINSLTISFLILLQFRFLEILKVTGEQVMPWDSLFLSSFLVLSIFLNITPAALGIKEILLAYSAVIISISSQDAIVASVLDRIVNASVLLILGPVAVYYLKGGEKQNGKE